MFITGFKGYFLAMTPKTKVTTTKKNDKLYFIKIKTFFISKNLVRRVKRQPMEWEKVFVNHIPGKRVTKYQGFLQIMNKQKSTLKNDKELNTLFSKKDKWPTNAWKDDQHH